MKRVSLLVFSFYLLVSLTSCKVEFSPNAEWRDVPVVYCVMDPEEDTVWVRVQRAFLSEDNMYQYTTVADSINYAEGQIAVHLLAWRNGQLLSRWNLTYTEVDGKPEGNFAGGIQPVFYCVPGEALRNDTDCVFQLVVLDSLSGDTMAQSRTSLVGFRPKVRMGNDSVEQVLISPSGSKGKEFGYRIGCRGEIKWYALPKGRRYQPILTFYYEKAGDTFAIRIPGTPRSDADNANILNSYSISQDRLLSYVKNALADNRDSLYTVNNVDITIAVCNEDLNAYLNAQNAIASLGTEAQPYTNIEGGLGVFASRRSHIVVNVPCDSTGKPGYLPDELKNLHVGYYGDWGK